MAYLVEAGELYLGDASHLFLSAKRAGGRSERTIDEHRKKLDLFQRWMAARLGDGNAPYIGPLLGFVSPAAK